jgi:signal transduction histidine kinase
MMKNIYGITFIPCLVIIVIAFSLLQIVSHKVLRPIKKLAEVAQDYSKGDFDTKTEINSQDEIGQLAESMEYMASELSKLEEYRHEFISNISHDFRSPLTSIRGYVTAIQDGTIPPEKQDRYLGIVLDETNRLTKLTQGLLDLNRLEIYGPYLNLTDFDFIDIVKPTLNTFEIKCIDKNVAIYLNNHAEATVVTADKTKVQQVVYNLLDNALKFTPEGKHIYINIVDKGDKLQISIKDEGIGMSEETQKKIWTRFYKDDTSRGKDKGGTGLGLAITKEIIKAHNETIDVYSKEGEGSEFVFTLKKANDETTHSGETQILVNANES